MIGAVVFLVAFAFFVLISFAVGLPPGIWLRDWLNIPASEYSFLINGVVNGVVYGVIIWLVFSFGKMAFGVKKEPVEELEEALEKAVRVKEEASKILTELTEIKGIGSKRAEQLKAAGISTVWDLATSSAKDLSEKTGVSEKTVSKWIKQARTHTELR